MTRVWLDFIQPLAPRWQAIRYATLAIGIAACGYSLLQRSQLGQEQSALAWQSRDRARGEMRSSMRPDGRTTDSLTAIDENAAEKKAESVRNARLVLQQLNLPWDELFHSLESAVDKGIVILAVIPNPPMESISLQGKAASIDATLAFADRIRAYPQFSNVYLAREESLEASPGYPLQFTISAYWKTGKTAP